MRFARSESGAVVSWRVDKVGADGWLEGGWRLEVGGLEGWRLEKGKFKQTFVSRDQSINQSLNDSEMTSCFRRSDDILSTGF